MEVIDKRVSDGTIRLKLIKPKPRTVTEKQLFYFMDPIHPRPSEHTLRQDVFTN